MLRGVPVCPPDPGARAVDPVSPAPAPCALRPAPCALRPAPRALRARGAHAPRAGCGIPPPLVLIIQYFTGIVNMWNKKKIFTFLERTPTSFVKRCFILPDGAPPEPHAQESPDTTGVSEAPQICKKPTFLYTLASTRCAMASARAAPSFSTPSRYALSASRRLYSSCTGRSASMTLSATACLNTP